MNDLIKVYIKTDENNNIIDVNSSVFLNDITNYIKIDEGLGDKFSHAQSGYLSKGVIDYKGRYNYKYVDNKVVELTEEEKGKLFPIQEQLSREERLEKELLKTQAALAEMQANILLKNNGGTV